MRTIKLPCVLCCGTGKMEKNVKTLSISAVQSFLSCPQLYKHRYVSRLEPVKLQPALAFGSMGHLVLEHYYKSMQRGDGLFDLKLVLHEIHDDEIQGKDLDSTRLQWLEDTVAMIEAMITAYLVHYVRDEAKWRILFVEECITNPKPIYANDHHLGIPDLCVQDRDTGEVWIWDHKFMRTVSDGMMRKLPLDLQINGYQRLTRAWLNENGHKDAKIAGVAYNVIKKSGKRLKKKQTHMDFIREICHDYTTEPEKYFFRVFVRTTEQHSRFFDETMEAASAGIMAAEMNDRYPKNPGHCDNYGACSFLDLCLDGEKAKHFYRPKERRK